MTDEPVVWIVDREQWARACLRAELIERGCDAVGFVELSQALAAMHHPFIARPRLIVLELHGQALTHDWLNILARSGIPTIILGGARELNDEPVKRHEWAATMQRPYTIGAVADAVERLLGQAGILGA